MQSNFQLSAHGKGRERHEEIMPGGCRMLRNQKDKTHSCANNCPNCTCRPAT